MFQGKRMVYLLQKLKGAKIQTIIIYNTLPTVFYLRFDFWLKVQPVLSWGNFCPSEIALRSRTNRFTKQIRLTIKEAERKS